MIIQTKCQSHGHCIFIIFSLKEPKVKEKGFGRWYADYASKATPRAGVYRHLPEVQAFIQLAGKLCSALRMCIFTVL
jgi:hypothetical protein